MDTATGNLGNDESKDFTPEDYGTVNLCPYCLIATDSGTCSPECETALATNVT